MDRPLSFLGLALVIVVAVTGCATGKPGTPVPTLRPAADSEVRTLSDALTPLMKELDYFEPGSRRLRFGCRIAIGIWQTDAINAGVSTGSVLAPCFQLVVSEGALKSLSSLQLQALLAHELAHVHLNHSFAAQERRESERKNKAAAATVANAGAAVGGPVGAAIWAVGGLAFVGVETTMRGYDRQEEVSADEVAAILLTRVSGRVGCSALADVFARGSTGGGLEWLSTHPSSAKRVEDVQSACATLRPDPPLPPARRTIAEPDPGTCPPGTRWMGKGCTAIEVGSGPRPSDDVLVGSDLHVLQRVLILVERSYVEPPDYAAIVLGAVQGLAELAPDGAFRVTESEREIGVSYRAGNDEPRTVTVGRQLTRQQAVAALTTVFALAREADPARPVQDLERAMIVRALARLDRDSSFLDAERYHEKQSENAGDLGGAGLELTIRENSLTVVAPIEGGRAQRAGMQPGDRLEQIDGVSTKDMALPNAVRRLRGIPGTKVAIAVARAGWPEPRVIEIIRERVPVVSVVTRHLGDSVVYTRLRFDEMTARELERQLEPSARAGMRGLILDLRSNSGGLLTAAVEVAEMFLKTGKLISYTEGRARNQNMRFIAAAKKADTAMPMVVLVNGRSAGGAEIVAGALQDWARASLLGTRTFGRASIQTIIPLSDGSGLELTTAKWFTPKGRSAHGQGLTPDLFVEGADAPPATSGTTGEDLLAHDAQLRSALEYLTRLIVASPRQ